MTVFFYLQAGLIAIVGFLVYKFYLYPQFLSPLRLIPGPPNQSYFFGNLQHIFDSPAGIGHHSLVQQYGPTVRYYGMFASDRLVLTDPASLHHVLLTKSYEYPKPSQVRGDLGRILGYGILFAEGDDHRRQRKIMNPAFSAGALKELVPIFFECSYKLREKWYTLLNQDAVDVRAWKDNEAAQKYQATKPAGEIVMEVSAWTSKVTLDIIGLTGFGYEFNSVEGKSTELATAFSSLTSSGGSKMTASRLLIQRVLGQIIGFLPIARFIPNARLQAVRKAFTTMETEAMKIVTAKKKEAEEIGLGEKGGKDLMTLLLRSNSDDAKNKLSDAELMGSITTFILAGHETTSTMLTWTLWTLARYPEIQTRLRKEIRAGRKVARAQGRDEMTSDELGGLEYLDAITREILRVESAVVATVRTSTHADTIPLSTPIISTTGESISSISVPANQTIFLSIYSANRNKAIFGEDADDFNPDRWLSGKVGEKVSGTGVYSNMLSFLAGPRSCIGYKFAILELKAILSVLVDSFQFAERSPGLEVERRSAIVMRPYIIGEEEDGGKMPLRVSRAEEEEEE